MWEHYEPGALFERGVTEPPAMDPFWAWLSDREWRRIGIEGAADCCGEDAIRQALERAEHVAQALGARGVARDRIETRAPPIEECHAGCREGRRTVKLAVVRCVQAEEGD
jgi:hypothetical protein